MGSYFVAQVSVPKAAWFFSGTCNICISHPLSVPGSEVSVPNYVEVTWCSPLTVHFHDVLISFQKSHGLIDFQVSTAQAASLRKPQELKFELKYDVVSWKP